MKSASFTRTVLLTTALLVCVAWASSAKERGEADIVIPLGKDRSSHVRIEITHFSPHEGPHFDIEIEGAKVNKEPIYLGKDYGGKLTFPIGGGKEVEVNITPEGKEANFEIEVHGAPELEGKRVRFKISISQEGGYEVQVHGVPELEGKPIQFRKLPDGQFVQEPWPTPRDEETGKNLGTDKMTVVQPPDRPTGDIIPEREPPPAGDIIPEREPQLGEIDRIPPQQPPPWVTPPPSQPLTKRGGIAVDIQINSQDFQSQ